MRRILVALVALAFFVSGCAASSASNPSQAPTSQPGSTSQPGTMPEASIPVKNGVVAGPAEDFATGWQPASGPVTGRPVDVTVAPDGSLFVSDDTFNVIYHIWYRA